MLLLSCEEKGIRLILQCWPVWFSISFPLKCYLQ